MRCICFMAWKMYFNPRTHGECNWSVLFSLILLFLISIHALTGSAMLFAKVCLSEMMYFNPRTHGECDQVLLLQNFVQLWFQSTHSRGVRHQGLWSCKLTRLISIHALTGSATLYAFVSSVVFFNFNPRTHGECDKDRQKKNGAIYRFQSTHSRGVRRT